MTQQHMRRVEVMYFVWIAIALTIGTLFIARQINYQMLFDYRVTMIERVAYLTSLLEWFPSAEMLISADIDTITQTVPMTITLSELLPDSPAVDLARQAQGIGASSDFPGVSFEFSNALDRLIVLTELVSEETVFGSASGTTMMGVIFIILTVAVSKTLLQMANLVGGEPTALARRTARACVVLALVVAPLLLCYVMVVVIRGLSQEVQQITWRDNVERTTLLMSQTYLYFTHMYPGSFPTTLLSATLHQINQQLSNSALTSMYLYNSSSGLVDLPRASQTHAEMGSLDATLLECVSRHVDLGLLTSQYIDECQIVVGGAPITSDDVIYLLVVKQTSGLVSHLNSGPVMYAFVFLILTVGVGGVAGVLFYPWHVLGQLQPTHGHTRRDSDSRGNSTDTSDGEPQFCANGANKQSSKTDTHRFYGTNNSNHNNNMSNDSGGTFAADTSWTAGPWAWRVSPMWPMLVALQLVVMLVAATLVISFGMTQLSTLYTDAKTFVTQSSQYLQASKQQSEWSTMLTSNYVDMLTGEGLNLAVLNHSGQLSSRALKMISRFYQRVYVDINSVMVDMSSIATALSALNVSAMPLLRNDASVTNFLTTHTSTNWTTMLSGLVDIWDALFVFGLITVNTDVIVHGNITYEQNILDIANIVAGSAGQELFTHAVSRVKLNAQVYARTAAEYHAQVSRTRHLSELYSGPVGRMVVKTEESAVQVTGVAKFGTSSYFSLYQKNIRYLFVPTAAMLLATGLCAMVNISVMTRLFARSRGATTGRDLLTRASSASGLATGLPGSDHRAGKGGGPVRPVPSNDFTAPLDTLSINHCHLWRAMRGGVGCAALVTVLCTALFLVCNAELVTMIDSVPSSSMLSGTLADAMLQQMRNVEESMYSCASWLRAYVSRDAACVYNAVESTFYWSTYRPVQWRNGHLPADKTGAELTGARNYRASLLNIASLVSMTMASQGDLTIYEDFANLTRTCVDNLNMVHLAKCLSPDQTKELGALMVNLSLAFLVSANATVYDGLFTTLDTYKVQNDTTECGISVQEVMLVHYIAGLRHRTSFQVGHSALANGLSRDALTALSQVYEISQNSLYTLSSTIKRVDVSLITWFVLVLAWLSTLFIGLVYNSAWSIFTDTYFS